MSVHEGHRKRMKQRFAQEGLSGFREHEVLEMLLYYCIPQRDTNEIAHRLIDAFGSLPNVLNAPVRELKRVEGIGDNAAIFLSLIRQLNTDYRSAKDEKGIFNTYEKCGEFLFKKLFDKKVETVGMLSLDAKCSLINYHIVGQGSISSANVPIRRIVDLALSDNAASIVIGHNHPGGMAIPSDADVETTFYVAKALAYVDVMLCDHIIVVEDDYVSLVASNIYNPDQVFDGK